jgi:hypothetical protein
MLRDFPFLETTYSQLSSSPQPLNPIPAGSHESCFCFRQIALTAFIRISGRAGGKPAFVRIHRAVQKSYRAFKKNAR